MRNDRQAIWSLLALGRITPREAERLLAVWNAGREELWVVGACLAGCLAACLAQFEPVVARLAQALLPASASGLHHAALAITYRIGGVL